VVPCAHRVPEDREPHSLHKTSPHNISLHGSGALPYLAHGVRESPGLRRSQGGFAVSRRSHLPKGSAHVNVTSPPLFWENLHLANVVHSEDAILRRLRGLGARRLERIRFRRNRSTIWSLTQSGRALNLHVAYRTAPWDVIDAFATVAREGFRKSDAYHRAAEIVRSWPGLEVGLARVLATGSRRTCLEPGPCAATAEQHDYLVRLYRALNQDRFDGALPSDIPIRLSRRMRSRLGHMIPAVRMGRRWVVEIAINLDLMLRGNEHLLVDTLLHEMAHAADYLRSGRASHGPTWRAIAKRVGCEDRACWRGGMRQRRTATQLVTRVPPWPTDLKRSRGRRRSRHEWRGTVTHQLALGL
jgi:hypothetical protein